MKTLQNNFTTPQQSKQLLELGVPADSADCCYDAVCGKNYDDSGSWQGWKMVPHILSLSTPNWSNHSHYPCWSVGRLMEIIRICNLTAEKPWVYIEQDNIHAMITAIIDGANNHMLDFSKLED